jgi:hypothetical protein
MKRIGMGWIAGCWIVALAASGIAADLSGTVGACVDILPAFSSNLDVGMTIAGDAWTFSSATAIDVTPSLGIDESLQLTYDLDVIRFSATATMGIMPWSFGSAALSATLDLFQLTILEDEPHLSLDSSFAAGATLNGAVDVFADLTARLGLELGDHSLTSTTTLSLLPLGVTSALLAHVSLGNIRLAEEDGAATVSAHILVSQGVIPFAFSYAQLNATVSWQAMSLLNSITYYGDTSVLATSTATLVLEPVTIRVWGSYSSTSGQFSAGACVSVPW